MFSLYFRFQNFDRTKRTTNSERVTAFASPHHDQLQTSVDVDVGLYTWPLAVAAGASETGAAAMHTLPRHHPLSLSGDVPLSFDTVTQQPCSY